MIVTQMIVCSGGQCDAPICKRKDRSAVLLQSCVVCGGSNTRIRAAAGEVEVGAPFCI